MKKVFFFCALLLVSCFHEGECPEPVACSAASSSVLRLRLFLPEDTLPEVVEKRLMGDGSDYVLRCIAELYEAGTSDCVLRREVNPTAEADGRRLVELSATAAVYDLLIWTDYATASDPVADCFYNTGRMKAVSIVTNPYVGGTEGKDASCFVVTDIVLPEEGLEMDVSLVRPLAKYRIIATNAETYRQLSATDSARYPPIETLSVSVAYDNFLPSSINVATLTINDARAGISFSGTITEAEDFAAGALLLASDCVLADTVETTIGATLYLTNASGGIVATLGTVRIPFLRGRLTTLTGDFLPATSTGATPSGGVTISNEWKEDIVIRF